jgi:hypothetical protein
LKVKEIVEAILLYVGIPAITLYPLGFVALGLQMWRDPFFPSADFGPIWDAVSLIPQTQVIGTGVELLYLSVISTLFGVGIASLTFHFLRRRRPSAEEKRWDGGLWGLYLLVLLPVAAVLTYSSVPLDGLEDLPYVAGFLIFSIGGGLLVGYTRIRQLDGYFMTGIAVAYVGTLLAALCIAPLDVPNLPIIRIDARVGAEESCQGPPDKTFVKLEESETHWHVYNQSGVYSIPYRDVRYARYYEQDCPGLRDQEG